MSSSQGTPTGQNGAGADPSMEDILASIRRILSEDGAPAQPGTGTTLPPALAQAQKNVLSLDSSMLVREPQAAPPIASGMPLAALNAIVSPGMETHVPPVHVPVPPPPVTPAPQPQSYAVAPPPQPELQKMAPAPIAVPAPVLPVPHVTQMTQTSSADMTNLVAPSAAAAASASVGELVRTLAAERHAPVYRGGPTLEDIVRDEMRPLVKAWLDSHLPPMVERLVRLEIERVVNRSLG